MKTIQAVLGLIALVGIVSALVRYRAHRLSARAFHPKARSHDPITTPSGAEDR